MREAMNSCQSLTPPVYRTLRYDPAFGDTSNAGRAVRIMRFAARVEEVPICGGSTSGTD
jgi:hypothetical protein